MTAFETPGLPNDIMQAPIAKYRYVCETAKTWQPIAMIMLLTTEHNRGPPTSRTYPNSSDEKKPVLIAKPNIFVVSSIVNPAPPSSRGAISNVVATEAHPKRIPATNVVCMHPKANSSTRRFVGGRSGGSIMAKWIETVKIRKDATEGMG